MKLALMLPQLLIVKPTIAVLLKKRIGRLTKIYTSHVPAIAISFFLLWGDIPHIWRGCTTGESWNRLNARGDIPHIWGGCTTDKDNSELAGGIIPHIWGGYPPHRALV